MSFSSAVAGILQWGAQTLEVPTMICLILLVLIMVFTLASLLVECFTERRHYKVNHRAVMVRMHESDYDGIIDAIKQAGLLKSQARALLRIAENMGLPDEELFALSQIELETLDRKNRRRVNFTDVIAKIAPMLGLMGTLIPLGPGIVAMGQGDLVTLSSSMDIAFNTTITGLVVAVLAVIVSRIRTTWYGRYAAMMNALSSCILEEATIARERGIKLPCKSWKELLEEDDRLSDFDFDSDGSSGGNSNMIGAPDENEIHSANDASDTQSVISDNAVLEGGVS